MKMRALSTTEKSLKKPPAWIWFRERLATETAPRSRCCVLFNRYKKLDSRGFSLLMIYRNIANCKG